MKTKAEYVAPIMPIVLDKNFTRAEKKAHIENVMDQYAQQISQEFAEMLYTWESKLELLNVSIANLSEAANPNTMTTFTVLQYQQMQLSQCIEEIRPIIAKFMEEREKK